MSYKINITHYLDELISSGTHDNEIAILDGEKTISFSCLYKKIKQLAIYIQKLSNNEVGKNIGVFLPKSAESVLVDLAIIMSGNAYLNLDKKNPIDRLCSITETCDPLFIITDDTGFEGFGEKIKLVNPFVSNPQNKSSFPEFSFEAAEDNNIKFNRDYLSDVDPLCIITTSGSTGIPKAVALSHRGLIDFAESVEAEKLITGPHTIGSISPSVFDIYLFEMIMMMKWGCKMVILPEKLAAFPLPLLKYMEEQRISFIFWVPTIMVNIANQDLLSLVNLSSLRTVWFAGEVFPTSKFNYWREHFPASEFVNLYGPIEISIDCLFYRANEKIDESETIPIGKGFRNTKVIVLNEKSEVVSDGEVGELYIGGSGVALGYYNNKEKTEASFVKNPLISDYNQILYRTGDLVKRSDDGNYIFLGRKDSMIKRSGYRIELGEIEHAAVDTLALVKNCCAVFDGEKITLFYEAKDKISSADFTKSLLKKIPKYMLPNSFVNMEELPRNINGKIDRNYLKNKVLNEKGKV